MSDIVVDTREAVVVPDKVIKEQAERMKRLKPLRIDSRTVIYVTEDKCNEDYRRAYIERTNPTVEPKKQLIKYRPHTTPQEDIERIIELHKTGARSKEIAHKLDISYSTVYRYVGEYKKGLRL